MAKRKQNLAVVARPEQSAAQPAHAESRKPEAAPNFERIGRVIAALKYHEIQQADDGTIVAIDTVLSDRPAIRAPTWREFLRLIMRAPRLTGEQERRRCEFVARSKGYEAQERVLTSNVVDTRREIVVVNATTGAIAVDEPSWARAHALVAALPSITGREISPSVEDLVAEVAMAKGYRTDMTFGTANFWSSNNMGRAIRAEKPFATGALATVLVLPPLRRVTPTAPQRAIATVVVPIIDRRAEREATEADERLKVSEMVPEDREAYLVDHPELARRADTLAATY